MKSLKIQEHLLHKSVLYAAIGITVYAILNPISTRGGELLFTLPLTLCLCMLAFPNLLTYQRDGWGLKAFYTVILVRYLLIPLVTVMEGKFATGGLSCYSLFRFSDPISYSYAIISMDIELLTSLYVINRYYLRDYEKHNSKTRGSEFVSLRPLGVCVSLFFLWLMFARGGVESFIRMGIVTEALEKEIQTDHHGIDVMIIKPLMGFLVITVSGYFGNLHKKNRSFFNVIIPLVVAFCSCILIVGNNRMQMVYLALCAISVLIAAFPTYKRLVTSILLPTMIVIIVSFTLFKQFGIVVGQDSVSTAESDDWVTGLTAYACGPENTAHTFDNQIARGHNETFDTFLSDIITYNTTTSLPGLSILRSYVKSTPMTFDYAVDGTEMVSTAGLCAFYGHGFWGGLLLVFVNYFVIARLLAYFEVRSKVSSDLASIYIYNWCAILFGISMCYCTLTLWDNVTYVPVWIWALIKINNFGK